MRDALNSMRITFDSKIKELNEEKSDLNRERKILLDIELERSKLAHEKKKFQDDKKAMLMKYQEEKLEIAQAKEELDEARESFILDKQGAIKEMEEKIHEFNSVYNSSIDTPPALEKYVKRAKSEIRQVRTDTEEQICQNQKEVEEDKKTVKETISTGEKIMQELSALITQAQNRRCELKEQKTATEKAARRFDSQIKSAQLNKGANNTNNHSVSPNSSINEKESEERII